MIGIRATARAGHHAATVAVATASPMPATGSHSGMFQRVDAVGGGRLEGRRRGQPGDQAGAGAGDGGGEPDGGAVGDHGPAEVARGGAGGGEQAELAHAAVGEGREARPGHEAHEDHGDGGDDEHRDGGGGLLGLLPRLDEPLTGRDAGPEPVGLLAVGVDEQGDRLRGLAGGQHEGVLVVEVGGVLDEADDLVAAAADVDLVAERGVEVGGGALGEGDLVGRRRPAALEDRDHRAGERAVGLGRAELDGGGRARDRHRLVADHLDGAEPLLGLGGVGRDVLGSGDRVLEAVVGGAELGHSGGGEVVGRGGAEHRRGDGDGDEGEHQHLLAPLPPVQAPGPAAQGTPGDAVCRRSSLLGHEQGLGPGGR